jgi:hypothetical protein
MNYFTLCKQNLRAITSKVSERVPCWVRENRENRGITRICCSAFTFKQKGDSHGKIMGKNKKINR